MSSGSVGKRDPQAHLGGAVGIANIEAEQALLGALLLNNEVLDRIGFVAPEHFYEPVHGRIFTQARDWVQAGKLASPVTLKPVLADDEGLQELGGTDYLARLAGATISIVSARDYAETVMELYSRREVITAAEGRLEPWALQCGGSAFSRYRPWRFSPPGRSTLRRRMRRGRTQFPLPMQAATP